MRLDARILAFQIAGFLLAGSTHSVAQSDAEVALHLPARAPRTAVLPDKRQAFREYCTKGDGAKAFGKIKADFDKDYLRFPFPAEPLTYGDPEPERRTSDKADKWRAAQDVCGQVSGVAEAATVLWLATGREQYLAKAKDFLLKSCAWHFAPDWNSGPVNTRSAFRRGDLKGSQNGFRCVYGGASP